MACPSLIGKNFRSGKGFMVRKVKICPDCFGKFVVDEYSGANHRCDSCRAYRATEAKKRADETWRSRHPEKSKEKARINMRKKRKYGKITKKT